MGGGVGSLRCALESSPWVTLKTPVLMMKRDCLQMQGWQKAVLKSSPVLGGGVGGQCPGSLHEGPHSEDTGTWWVSPLPAHRLLTGPLLRGSSLGRAQPVCPSVGSPLWVFMLPFTLLLPLPSFSFLFFLFPFSSMFVFLSSLDYSHFPPYFVAILYISFTLKSGPSRTPVLQLMILKRIFWCINFS